ncbi:MAG: methyltransferase domain-containing protein [Desulfobacteraceae bacterium]|nr:methyltransferase domain-containing protein [Desulfobacteraceae bacterium]
MLKVKDIINLPQKPELYQKGTAMMWTDSYISKQLLDVHLNPDLDLASRKKKTIDSTVEWILDKAGKRKLKILDLGCGPGLYSQLLAKKGHQVTGVDFSKHSIKYAAKTAKADNLDIEYRQQNYLELDDQEKFDLVILIFTDFGVLTPDDRSRLLSNIHRALKPGGTFLFDVLNDKNIDQMMSEKSWEISEKGFWRENPYLALSDSFYYPENKVVLYQHCVIDEDNCDVYRFWTHFFSHEDLSAILSKNRFEHIEFHDNVLPEGDATNHRCVTFCITSKTT